jgi:cbb3-type cytochrome oxidase cytochrome c subunit
MIGIPYARHVRPDTHECPFCKEHIVETQRKDFESFGTVALAAHYAAKHPEKLK